MYTSVLNKIIDVARYVMLYKVYFKSPDICKYICNMDTFNIRTRKYT